MLLAIGERHDDVHHRRRQRQEPFDLFSVTHVTTMTTLDLLCQQSTEYAFSRAGAYLCPHVPVGRDQNERTEHRPDAPKSSAKGNLRVVGWSCPVRVDT
jgi:hypothetical protein